MPIVVKRSQVQLIQWIFLGAGTIFLMSKLWRNLQYRPTQSIDTVLSIDVASKDCLYRIQRDNQHYGKRIVYVWLKWPDLIPEDCRTFGPSIIRELSKLNEWLDRWETLTITRDQSRLRIETNAFRPHKLSTKYIYSGYQFFSIFDLQDTVEIKTRTRRCRLQGKQCYLKIARFRFETAALEREIMAYHILASHGSKLAPAMLGFVYEETCERVIGFVTEEVIGRYPTIKDFTNCDVALQQLHNLGIVHGDTNIYNIIIANDGIRFVDFEESQIGDKSQENWIQRALNERRTLEDKLLETSGIGRPWE